MPTSQADNLITSLRNMLEKLKTVPQNNKFTDHWSWQGMPLDKSDIRFTLEALIERFDAIDWSKSSDETNTVCEDLAQKIDVATQLLVPNLYGAASTANFLITLFSNVDTQVTSTLSLEQLRGAAFFPTSLKRSVDAATQRLNDATKSMDDVEKKITAINAAYDAAEKLPATQSDLSTALDDIRRAAREVEQLNSTSSAAANNISAIQANLTDVAKEADATIKKVRQAYRAATSQGLAHAFSKKSRELGSSLLFWAAILIFSLVAAGLISHERFPEIIRAATSSSATPEWRMLFLHITLGALSIAPPIWVAWVATKQIGQRFRLAEDYAYKAALS